MFTPLTVGYGYFLESLERKRVDGGHNHNSLEMAYGLFRGLKKS